VHFKTGPVVSLKPVMESRTLHLAAAWRLAVDVGGGLVAVDVGGGLVVVDVGGGLVAVDVGGGLVVVDVGGGLVVVEAVPTSMAQVTSGRQFLAISFEATQRLMQTRRSASSLIN